MPAAITVASFLGEAHAIDSKLLPPSTGVLSTNQRPGRGDFRQWLNSLQVATVATSPQRLSIYQMAGGYWFSWTTVVNALKGFDSDDTTERFYFTGSGTPKWSNNVIGLGGGPPYPQATRELAVPAPTTTMVPSVSVAGTGAVADWYFVQTFVNDLGWESAPGPLSTLISAAQGSMLAIANMGTAPAGAYGLTRTRIYKAIVATDGSAAFLFHSEYSIGTTSGTDSGQALGEQLATGAMGVGSSWEPPPAAGFGLTKMWNGMLAMMSGKTVYVCEPYAPYAWPARYQIELADNCVALVVFGQRMLALTDGDAYLIQGGDPMSLDSIPLKLFQPCVSARSVVSFEDCVVWACPSGLWRYGSTGSYLLTLPMLDDAQWQALVPSTLQCSRHANLRLVFAFYDTGTKLGFCIDVDNPTGIYGLSAGCNAVYRATDGKMHVLVLGSIRKWDADTTLMSATFTSKVFDQPMPMKLTAMDVTATVYPVTVAVTGFDVAGGSHTIFSGSVSNQEAVRLKSGMFESYQVQVSSSAGPVQSVRLAESVDDLRSA